MRTLRIRKSNIDSNRTQLQENINSLEVLPQLTDEVMARIADIISVVPPSLSHGNE